MLDADAVHVWLAFESLLDDPATAERFTASMSDDERSRERRLVVDPARRLHLLARGVQREVLSSYLPGTSARELQFTSGATGRPTLAPPFDASGLDFNLAHTPGLVALAITRGASVGIDVEIHDKKVPLEVARRYFSPVEVEALEALPALARPRRFLRLWTLKEAYLKATGTGLAGGLDSMTFHIDDAGACAFERAADPEARRWSFSQFEVGTRHILALAWLRARVSRPVARIEWREFARAAGGTPMANIKPLLGQEQRAES
jgi:4'-phosphopantetheinyl transferase